MKWIYRLYQLVIALPLLLIATLLTSIVTIVGCMAGGGKWWGYYPSVVWSKLVCRLLLLPIHVEGCEFIKRGQSYVFVANHQGAMDIFLMFGYLGHQFRWMMKRSLVSIPFVGYACRRAHHIFVDHRSPSATAETIRAARFVLEQGMSLAVFPEGTRTRTGRIGKFHRGAFLLADELQIPLVPVTIEGSYEVLPRTHDIDFVHRHPLRLIIHQPIEPEGQGREDINQRTQQAYDIIRQSLPERYR